MESAREIRDRLGPAPGPNPIDRLRHTVKVFAQEGNPNFDPFGLAIMATSNVYPTSPTTGLTYDDLASLLEGYERLADAAARALERCQVADDRSRAAEEAALILSEVVELDGTPRRRFKVISGVDDSSGQAVDGFYVVLDGDTIENDRGVNFHEDREEAEAAAVECNESDASRELREAERERLANLLDASKARGSGEAVFLPLRRAKSVADWLRAGGTREDLPHVAPNPIVSSMRDSNGVNNDEYPDMA